MLSYQMSRFKLKSNFILPGTLMFFCAVRISSPQTPSCNNTYSAMTAVLFMLLLPNFVHLEMIRGIALQVTHSICTCGCCDGAPTTDGAASSPTPSLSVLRPPNVPRSSGTDKIQSSHFDRLLCSHGDGQWSHQKKWSR